MSVLATPADLASYLGVTVDDARAQLMLDLAEDDAGSLVQPLPEEARGIILAVASRAYSNAAQYSSASDGQASASYSQAAAYLTRAERARLLRMAGRSGGAFTVNPAPNAGADYRDPLLPVTLELEEEYVHDYPDLIQ